MKKRILKYAISLSLISIFITSCSKDFLDQIPETSRSTENAYKTSSDFYNAITGCYSTLKSGGVYSNCSASSALLTLGEVVSDNSDYGSSRNTSTTSVFEFEDFNFSLSNPYFSSAWNDHYVGIGRVNTLLARLPAAGFDTIQKARFEGEARFLRAFLYFNLVRLFGDVPLVTTEFSDPNDANNILRTPAEQVYALITSDLLFAESRLPSTIPSSEAGRASKWAAAALLGKVYLTKKDYTNSANELNKIITPGAFTLLPAYASVFTNTTPYGTSSSEVMFAVQYKSGQIGQGSGIWTACVPWSVSTALFGITGGSIGDGFMRPTAEMANAYEPGDLRKDASMASSYPIGNSVVNERYVVKYKQTGSLLNDADIDFPVLRYADVLLMYAEALNEQGQTGTAIPFLNVVRKRAGLAARPITLAQSDARLAIESERRVELAFEGHRWFDLIRTGRYLPVMTSKGYATKEFNKLFPVPQRETDLNKQLTQNQGY